MREWSPLGLQGFSRLFPFLGHPLSILFPFEGCAGLIDLPLECRHTGFCWVQGFDGFDRKFYKSHAVFIS